MAYKCKSTNILAESLNLRLILVFQKLFYFRIGDCRKSFCAWKLTLEVSFRTADFDKHRNRPRRMFSFLLSFFAFALLCFFGAPAQFKFSDARVRLLSGRNITVNGPRNCFLTYLSYRIAPTLSLGTAVRSKLAFWQSAHTFWQAAKTFVRENFSTCVLFAHAVRSRVFAN